MRFHPHLFNCGLTDSEYPGRRSKDVDTFGINFPAVLQDLRSTWAKSVNLAFATYRDLLGLRARVVKIIPNHLV